MVQETNERPAGINSFRLGEKDFLIVSDGEVPYSSNCFAPGIARQDLDTIRGTNSDSIVLTHNIPVFKWNDRIVLIDAGNGYKSVPAGGHLVNNLKTAGITADSVTDIILTHAHSDHIGGLIDVNNKRVFPSAAVYISKIEYDFWMSDNPDFSQSKNTPEVLKVVQQNIQRVLKAVETQLQFFDETDHLFGFLRPIAAKGHTPGHFMFRVEAGNEHFIHMADICHEAVVLFNKPEWGTVFDIDFELAAQKRAEVLGGLAESGSLVFGYHMPWPGFGNVVKKENGFGWIGVKTKI